MGGRTFEGKALFAIKKRGVHIFEGGVLFGRLRYVLNGGNLSCTQFTFLLHFINCFLKLSLCVSFLPSSVAIV